MGCGFARGSRLLLALVLCWGVQPAAASKGLHGLKNICTAHFEPLVSCEGEFDGTPRGYHISLFEMVARELKLKNYKFKCLPFGEMLDDLLEGGKECDIGIGGITLTSERMRKGIHFSFPTYRGSLGILVKGKVRKGSTWSFLQPLHWSLWAAVGMTSLVIPIIVFFTESLSCHGFIHRRDMSRGLKQAIWDSFITLLNFGSFTVKSGEARLIVIGYGFLVLILVNTYVANLAAFLTITNIDASIKSLSDLFGKSVVAGAVYERRLLNQRVSVTANFTSAMKDDVVQEFLLDDRFDAVVYDEPWITHKAGLDCGLFALSETLSKFDYAFALPNRSKDVEELISKELIGLQEAGQMSKLALEFIQPTISDCAEEHEVSETESVDFNQLKGLWIILGTCMAVAITIMFVKWAGVFSISQHNHTHTSIRDLKRMETIVETVYHPHAVKVHTAESLRVMNVGIISKPSSVEGRSSAGLQPVNSTLQPVNSTGSESASQASSHPSEKEWERALDRCREDFDGQMHDIREFLEIITSRFERAVGVPQ